VRLWWREFWVGALRFDEVIDVDGMLWSLLRMRSA